MLIATFKQTTGWAGKTITYDNGAFTLEGHGPIRAADVLGYDDQGQLTWAYDGLRQWLGGLASPPPAPSRDTVQAETAGPMNEPLDVQASALGPVTADDSSPSFAGREGAMLVATFGASTAWVGKTITYGHGVFALEDHGDVTADAIMGYDLQGQLLWASPGSRAWVGSLSSNASPPPVSPAATAPAVEDTLIATFGPSTGWVGKEIVYSAKQFTLEGQGALSAEAVLDYGKMGHLVWATDKTRAWVRAQAASRSSDLMWLAALGPLWVGILFAAIPFEQLASGPFFLLIAPFVVLMIDWERMKKAGVNTSWLLFWAIVWPPVYIYLRQRRTLLTLGPLYLWIACLVVSLTLPVATAGGAG